MSTLTLLMLDVAVILVAARLAGALARRCGQPAVFGEILAGLVLLPLLLGDAVDDVVPPDVRAGLDVLAGVGVTLYMFLVGVELRREHLRVRCALAVATGSTVVPALLGLALGACLVGTYAPPGDETAFVLFVAVACAVTAFPVLARILAERRLDGTPVGVLALACAAVDDLAAWLLLAVVVVVAGHDGASPWRLLLLPVFVLLMVAVRPLLRRIAARGGAVSDLAVVLVLVLVSASATDWMGLHQVFGAFAAGLVLPDDGPMRRHVQEQLAPVTSTLLIPIFFVTAGLEVDLGSIGGEQVGLLAVVLAVAVGGKIGGTWAVARLRRLPARTAWTLGVLMNTRGLTELVVLDVGRRLGLLSTALYTVLVLMALVTTAMTGPLLAWGRPRSAALDAPTAGGPDSPADLARVAAPGAAARS